MATPPIVTQYAGPTPYKLNNFVTGNDVFTSPLYPNQISDLAIWLDGKDILNNGSNNPADGTPVSVWANKAPNSIIVNQDTIAYRPVFNSVDKGVVFSNTNSVTKGTINGLDTTYFSGNKYETIFILLNNKLSANNYTLLSPTSTKDKYIYLLSNTSTETILTTGTDGVLLESGNVTEGTPTLVSTWNSNGAIYHYINGLLTGNTNKPAYEAGANTLIGTDNYIEENANGFNGSISEIIIYSNVLSDSERQKVESYLYWKWGTFILDKDNPYKEEAYSNYLYPNIDSNLIPAVPRNLFSGEPTLDSNNYPLIKNFIQLPNILKNTKF